MSTREIASDLGVQIAMRATITSDTTTVGSVIDTAHYDGGYMFFINADDWTDGTYTVLLEDSPDTSVWTTVPDEKLIEPEGDVVISSLPAPGDYLKRIGAFSTDTYLRLSIVSTAVGIAGATIAAYVIKKGEIRPVNTL